MPTPAMLHVPQPVPPLVPAPLSQRSGFMIIPIGVSYTGAMMSFVYVHGVTVTLQLHGDLDVFQMMHAPIGLG